MTLRTGLWLLGFSTFALTDPPSGVARLGYTTGTVSSVINLDDRIAGLQLTQRVLNVRVRRLGPDQVFEIDTPNLAFTIRQPGGYRIEGDPDGDATTIHVRPGPWRDVRGRRVPQQVARLPQASGSALQRPEQPGAAAPRRGPLPRLPRQSNPSNGPGPSLLRP